MYCIPDSAFNRNLLRVLAIPFDNHGDGFLLLEPNADQQWLLRMWRVELMGPVALPFRG